MDSHRARRPHRARRLETTLKTLAPEKRAALFWSHVERQPNGCWLYTMKNEVNGYASITISGRNLLAHRYAYELERGPIPEGLQIDHLCRNRRCVNPDHLEAVTQAENLRRGEGWAGRNARKTHCRRGHEFTPENTRMRPLGRTCRACERIHEQNRSRRKEAGGS